ncbi:MAG: isochorismatase family protein [Acidimicrobiales bacterium]
MTSDLADGYATAGFSGRVGWGSSPALVVVDMVRAYTEAGSSLHLETAGAALAAMARLLDAARARRPGPAPVAFTRVSFQAGGVDAPLFWRKVPSLSLLVGDSPMGRFADGLEPGEGDLVVTKQYASAFWGTILAGWLTGQRVDTVVLGGFSTSGCVRATALDALQSGFRPIVVREACADRDPRPHEANLFDLDAKYADVVGLDEALAKLGSP